MADDSESRLREIAAEHGCYTESDFKLATGYGDNTVEAYCKRRKISYLKVGKNRFFPKAQLAKPEAVRERVMAPAKAML